MNSIVDDFAPLDEPARAIAPALAATEAEFGIVGGLLLNNGLFDLIVDRVRPEHFASDQARLVFAEISRQLSAGKAADVVTVFQALSAATEVSLADIASMAQFEPSAWNVTRYADIVVERFQARKLLSAGSEILNLAHDTTRPIADRIEEAQTHLAKLAVDACDDDEWSEIHEGLMEHATLIEQRLEGKVTGWGTGLSDLDDVLNGGLRPGSLYIIAARPSMGKTALALSIALHVSTVHPTAFFSLEMPLSELRDRQTAILGRAPLHDVIQPRPETSMAPVQKAVERSRKRKFYASDRTGLTLQRLRSQARKLKRQKGLDVIVLDYIGLMESTSHRESRTQQLGEISRGLKSLAKELGVAILCLAQLNRSVEQRGAHARPIMSDLRDCGEIEQDADVIVFVHREERANPAAGEQWKGHAELIVGKNRQGRCCSIHARYISALTWFTGWAGDPPERTAGLASRRGME